MVLHIVFFTGVLVLDLSNKIVITTKGGLEEKEKDHSVNQKVLCRLNYANWTLGVCVWVLNIVMIGLFAYLTVKFSKPLENYRQKFMVMFHSEDLDNVTQNQMEFQKAENYNKAA